MTQDIIFREVKNLPENLKKEVLDFLLKVKTKYEKQKATEKNTRQSDLNSERLRFGGGKYKITLAPDFDEPLEDFKDYM